MHLNFNGVYKQNSKTFKPCCFYSINELIRVNPFNPCHPCAN